MPGGLRPISKHMRKNPEHFYKTDYWIIGIFCLAILLTYFLLHDIYRPDNYDDPGFLSFLYNYTNRGTSQDLVFGSSQKDGYSGLVLFGKSCGFLYGGLLNQVGWTRSNSHLISTILILFSAFFWYQILCRSGFSVKFALFFSLALLLLEPFFGAGNQARSDALCFFLLSLALLFFTMEVYFISGLIAMMAFEVHPVGLSVFFYIGAAALARWETRKTTEKKPVRAAISFILGVFLGAGYYFILHRDALPLLFSTLREGNRAGFKIFPILSEYFFKTKYFRHLPEMVLILVCAGIFIGKKYWKRNHLTAYFFLAACLIALVIRRPNFMYMIFLYPAFLLLIFYVFQSFGQLRMIMVFLLIYLLPQYATVYFLNRDFSLQAYITEVKKIVPADNRPVIGNPNDWFALKDRDFYTLDFRRGIESLNLTKFYIIENDAYRAGQYPDSRSYIQTNYQTRKVGQFKLRREITLIREATRIGSED